MIDLQDTTSIYIMADWIEYYIISKNKSLSKSTITDLLQAYVQDLKEETIDSIFSELTLRNRLYGKASPFVVNGKIIEPIKKLENIPELLMCLIFSLEGVKKKKGINDGTKLFERLSNEAAKVYLGGESEVIGFPNARSLKEQIKSISLKTSESIGHKTPKPKDKDKGVDIIAWKSHEDSRPNQIILLLQCGAGINFPDKKPISIKAWRNFIHWSVDPLQGIMIPSIPPNETLSDLVDDYSLVFDRVRIFKAVYNKNLSDPTLRKEILNWCKKKI
ncbi:MAG: hypothetical protein LLF92_03945 [Planctomycetaceae bacterium]|nr:hypothetical protein [Planctomycetaceae bacterium]